MVASIVYIPAEATALPCEGGNGSSDCMLAVYIVLSVQQSDAPL